MGISRTPVRQAIRQLEGEGLVSIRANRETIVTAFTPTDVREIYQFRAAVEGMAAALAAGRTDGGSRTSPLLDIPVRMDAALASGQLTVYLELDIAFHDCVGHACGNASNGGSSARTRPGPTLSGTPLTYLTIESLRDNVAEHRAIYDAIRDAKAELAEKLTRVHIMSNGERLAEATSTPAAHEVEHLAR